MKVTAVDVAILPPEPIRSLAIGLSKKINHGDFHLNETDILPHITLGIGFVEDVLSIKNYVLSIAKKINPFEITVERVEGRYLMCRKDDTIFDLHKAICDAVDFVKTEDFEEAYLVKKGEDISRQTKDFANNFRWRNAYRNFVPHITIGWDDEVDASGLKADLPQSFIAREVYICQLGNFNTCCKVLTVFEFGNSRI